MTVNGHKVLYRLVFMVIQFSQFTYPHIFMSNLST